MITNSLYYHIEVRQMTLTSLSLIFNQKFLNSDTSLSKILRVLLALWEKYKPIVVKLINDMMRNLKILLIKNLIILADVLISLLQRLKQECQKW